jgi:hypothetical protein
MLLGGAREAEAQSLPAEALGFALAAQRGDVELERIERAAGRGGAQRQRLPAVIGLERVRDAVGRVEQPREVAGVDRLVAEPAARAARRRGRARARGSRLVARPGRKFG